MGGPVCGEPQDVVMVTMVTVTALCAGELVMSQWDTRSDFYFQSFY